jgi:hypothetical protein
MAFAFSLLWVLTGCRLSHETEATLPLAQRVTWSGRLPVAVSDSIPSDTDSTAASIRIHRLEFAGPEGPFHLELREYRTAYWAFAAWQSLAPNRPREGCFRLGSRWVFAHGPYLGITDSSAGSLYPGEFKDRLAFAAERSEGGQSRPEPLFALPSEFESFPLLGRIPGSERVSEGDFLGSRWSGPVFSAEYRCHEDTAIAFRAFPQKAESLEAFSALWKGKREPGPGGQGWRFQGQDEFSRPMIFEVFSEGLMGFSGCFDPATAHEYVEKLRKTQVFWRHP